jgi:hypothetical protein
MHLHLHTLWDSQMSGSIGLFTWNDPSIGADYSGKWNELNK